MYLQSCKVNGAENHQKKQLKVAVNNLLITLKFFVACFLMTVEHHFSLYRPLTAAHFFPETREMIHREMKEEKLINRSLSSCSSGLTEE